MSVLFGERMKPELIAIVISCFSFGVAALSLGWNIYRDVILKARVKVSVAKMIVASEGMASSNKLLISAVNFGPGKIRLNIIRYMHSSLMKRLFRTWEHGVLIHDYRNPLSGQLPITLDIGEKIDLIFPWDKENICSAKPTHIGIADSFGRTHWSPSKEVKKCLDAWERDFK
jgi:hypothetical protein